MLEKIEGDEESVATEYYIYHINSFDEDMDIYINMLEDPDYKIDDFILDSFKYNSNIIRKIYKKYMDSELYTFDTYMKKLKREKAIRIING